MKPGVIRYIGVLGSLFVLAGCHRGVRFENHVVSKEGVRYRLGALPPGWERVKLPGNDVAWFIEDTGHALSVNATCREHEDAPLDVLTHHLLEGFTERQAVFHRLEVVDEREALRSHYLAKLDGVPVELMLLVLKKDRCVFDFSYVSPLGRLDSHLAELDAMVLGFHSEEAS
ncbi:hypothetical protein MEBOL_002977 [Melittangium boletus DSM 14713]|uniref:Lipoprotein n=1 Tax=Melittangium boletus DSM 14713 TaxID=1294270 RepID=A0A250IEG1_9BACT|nr:hypothetical protein MEBOL_002977 [Melittangium boletus DSM 14713]